MRTARSEIPKWIATTYSRQGRERRRALQALCPCELKSHSAEAWQRVFEMAGDPDPNVRRATLHTMCDGSPAEYRTEIINALEARYHDSDRKVRRMARQALARYRHSGTVNFL